MLRKIALASAALVAAVVGFILVSSGDKGSRSAVPAPEGPRVTAAPSTQPRQVIRGSNPPIGPGDRPRFNVIDRDTGRVKYEFSAESWDWASDTLLVMQKPDIRIHMPGGESTQVTAKNGEFEIANTGRKDVDPKRGRLWGGVNVVIDRTTRQWREDESNRARLQRDQHPEFLVHIEMQEAQFDVESSRLAADGPVLIHSEEADVRANPGSEALRLTWNQVDNRIDFLTLRYGGTMELRRDAGVVDFALPGAERPTSTVSINPAAMFVQKQGNLTSEAAIATTQPIGPPMTADMVAQGLNAELNSHVARVLAPASAPATPDRAQRPGSLHAQPSHRARQPVVTYAAFFHDNVEVRQVQGTALNGQLDCDDLTLIFDVGRERRESAASAPSSQPAAARRAAQKAQATASQPAGPRTHITLTWTGPLEMRPVESATASHSATGRRFDVIATGKQVRVKDTQGEAICTRLIFRNETRAVWLTGNAQGPAQLSSLTGRKLAAPEIALEREAGRGFLRGAGYLSDPGRLADAQQEAAPSNESKPPRSGRSSEPVDIRWTSGVDLKLGRAPRPAPATQPGMRSATRTAAKGAAKDKTVDYLERAEFRGSVEMTQGARQLAGEEVTIRFGIPRSAGAMADNISTIDAIGDVRLRDADQVMNARQLHTDMMVTSDGSNVPRRAEGSGHVQVSQGQRRFEAEHMIVDFAEATPLDQKGPRITASRIRADGKVSARDPVRQLELEAQNIDAHLDDAGQLRSAIALGPGPDGWAYTKQGDYEINGHRVEINMPLQQASVPGRGHAVFVTHRDLDGRELSDAVRVNITFEKGMHLDGRSNVGLFGGRVHTSTDTHELTCTNRLTVRFADMPADSARPASSAPAVALPSWLRERLKGDSNADRPGGPAPLRKRPTYVVADGDAVALTTDLDTQGRILSRMRVSGPIFEVNLRAGRMDVPGRGTLMIEDYRPQKQSQATGRATSSIPPLGAARGEGPSQTAFFWGNAMCFNVNEDVVSFDKSVQMIHRSGGQILKGSIPTAMAADVSKLRVGSGREVRLDCDNLVAQFVSQSKSKRSDDPSGSSLRSRWTDLRRLDAIGQVHLQEGARTMFGDTLVFRGDSNTIVLKGRPDVDARMFDESEATQHARQWRGPLIIWNRTTGAVDAPDSQVSSR